MFQRSQRCLLAATRPQSKNNILLARSVGRPSARMFVVSRLHSLSAGSVFPRLLSAVPPCVLLAQLPSSFVLPLCVCACACAVCVGAWEGRQERERKGRGKRGKGEGKSGSLTGRKLYMRLSTYPEKRHPHRAEVAHLVVTVYRRKEQSLVDRVRSIGAASLQQPTHVLSVTCGLLSANRFFSLSTGRCPGRQHDTLHTSWSQICALCVWLLFLSDGVRGVEDAHEVCDFDLAGWWKHPPPRTTQDP